MARMESLLLSGNELSGEIPWSIGSIRTLKRLDLSNNQLWGDIPSAFGDLQSLESLGLQHNQLTGPVPRELTRIGSLRRVILNNNNLTGATPAGFVGETTSGLHIRIDNNPMASNRYSDLDILSFEERDLTATGQISGMDFLNETTVVLGDNQAAEFVRATLSAIFVRGGYLGIDSTKLPQDVDIEQFEEAIDAVNRGLRETGDRIRSINDLERVFELYDGPTLDIPDVGTDNDSYTFEAASPLSSIGNGFGHYSESIGGSGFSVGQSSPKRIGNMVIAASQTPVGSFIDCLGTRGHWPHKSTTTPGSIIGKATVRCTQVSGPPQTITFNARSYLQQASGRWIFFTFWQRVGTSMSATETGNTVNIHENRLVAVLTECRTGIYRTMLSLRISSELGNYQPYPGYHPSSSRFLSC